MNGLLAVLTVALQSQKPIEYYCPPARIFAVYRYAFRTAWCCGAVLTFINYCAINPLWVVDLWRTGQKHTTTTVLLSRRRSIIKMQWMDGCTPLE